MGAYKQKRRIGSFVAVNSGVIEGCVANICANFGSESAGFVYENSGEIDSSLTAKVGSKKGIKGFYSRNSGRIEDCGYIASKRSETTEKDGRKVYKFGNQEQYICSDTPNGEILKRLKIDEVWKMPGNDQVFEPDIAANHVAFQDGSGEIVEIGSSAELKEIIEKINSGDREAASAKYRLAENINMKGAKLQPIGISETMPFVGVFDGNGKTVSNFTVNCADCDAAGFFGYTKNAKVVNLSLDYILKGAKSIVAGGMAGEISGGEFENCKVLLGMSPGRCTGGFAGRNSGHIKNCYVGGKMNDGAVFIPWFLVGGILLLALFVGGTVTYVIKMTRGPYVPAVIDPNQVPVIDNEKVDPPPAGTSRISLELNQDIYVAASSMVGQMDYINPHRSTQDVVIRLCITDAELVKNGYDLIACKVRTQAEMDAEGYDPTKAYTELYRSGRLQIGYKLSVCQLSELPNGEKLKVGDYDMVMLIDAYDPETNEKAIVNAQAVTTIHILDQ